MRASRICVTQHYFDKRYLDDRLLKIIGIKSHAGIKNRNISARISYEFEYAPEYCVAFIVPYVMSAKDFWLLLLMANTHSNTNWSLSNGN